VTQKEFPCGAIDGIYGPRTEAACRAFQAANELAVDGICGSLTWGKLLASGGDRLMDWGFSKLIAAKGRVFAIKQFQTAMGLAVDGIIGPKTTAALDGGIIVPRIPESEMRCQCLSHCDGYPKGHVSMGVRILSERIFREVEKDFPNTLFFVTNRAHPSASGAIAGGYRCEWWNEQRGGANNSMHKSGLAMDVFGECTGVPEKTIRQRIEDVALRLNTKGGVGSEGAYIVHIDTRGTKARWRY
jgi:hypothetical protein